MTAKNHAGAPEERYVALHKQIERGDPSDEVWAELSRVCFKLGHIKESISCVEQVKDPELHFRAQLFLSLKGLMNAPDKPDEDESPEPDRDRFVFRAEVADAVSYLSLGHMPLTVICTSLVFLLVVGGGGLLTAGSSAWTLLAIALLPIALVLGVVGALTRQIILEASHGLDQAPRVPDTARVGKAAAKFATDLAVVFGVGIVIPSLAWQLGLTPLYSLPFLVLGACLMPMAVALCMVRNDRVGMSPRTFVPAIWHCGAAYAGIVLVAAVLFAPAVCAVAFTTESIFYLRAAVIGPLAIAPLFITARLAGRILFFNRVALGDLMVDASGATKAELPEETSEDVETFDSEKISSRIGSSAGKEKPSAKKQRPQSSAKRAASASASQARPRTEQRPAQQASEKRGSEKQSSAQGRPSGKRPSGQRKPSQKASAQRQPSPSAKAERRPPKRRARLDAPLHPETGGAGETAADAKQNSEAKAENFLESIEPCLTVDIEEFVESNPIDFPGATIVTGEERRRVGASRGKPS